MTPELRKTEGPQDAAEPDATQRISARTAEQPEATEPEERKTAFSSLREAYLRARDGRQDGPARKAEQNRKERGPKQRSIDSCRCGDRHDLRVSWHVLQLERHEGTRREQNEAESWQAGDRGDWSGRKPGIRDAVAERGYERTGWEQRSNQRG